MSGFSVIDPSLDTRTNSLTLTSQPDTLAILRFEPFKNARTIIRRVPYTLPYSQITNYQHIDHIPALKADPWSFDNTWICTDRWTWRSGEVVLSEYSRLRVIFDVDNEEFIIRTTRPIYLDNSEPLLPIVIAATDLFFYDRNRRPADLYPFPSN